MKLTTNDIILLSEPILTLVLIIAYVIYMI